MPVQHRLLHLGAIAATGTALYLLPAAPAFVIVPAMVLAGAIGGALWALIPGALKAFFKVNEIITSLMLNYVAILFSEYLVYGPWENPQGFGFPGTAPLPAPRKLTADELPKALTRGSYYRQASAPETLVNPLVGVGARCTNQ